MANKINILHIDDSEKIRMFLKLMLLELPNINEITAAPSLNEAKESLKKENTDVIILDIELPDGNGMVFLKWIKEYYPKTCVIMLSNHADKFHRAVAKQSGADYFFDKSKEFEQVLETISQLN